MRLGTVKKQPIERFSYTVDYSEALTEGDNLDRVFATVQPEGLIVTDVGPYDPRVKFWADGGEDGINYTVTLTVHTMDGRIFQDEILFRVREVS